MMNGKMSLWLFGCVVCLSFALVATGDFAMEGVVLWVMGLIGAGAVLLVARFANPEKRTGSLKSPSSRWRCVGFTFTILALFTLNTFHSVAVAGKWIDVKDSYNSAIVSWGGDAPSHKGRLCYKKVWQWKDICKANEVIKNNGSNFTTGYTACISGLEHGEKYKFKAQVDYGSGWTDKSKKNETINGLLPSATLFSGSKTICSGESFYLTLSSKSGNEVSVDYYAKDVDGKGEYGSFGSSTIVSVSPDKTTTYSLSSVKDKCGVSGSVSGEFIVKVDCDSDGWKNIFDLYDEHGMADKLYAGDFDGDGAEELLAVSGDWITMSHYENCEWQWGWSNYGDQSAGGGIYPYRNNLIVGDFDGDGKDEILGVSSWLTVFHFKIGDDNKWDWHEGSNYGGDSVGKGDKLHAGDFDGDGKDELLGVNGDWISMYHYEDNDWQWGWSNYGDQSAGNGIYPYRDNLVVGDFDADGKDELLGLSSWATVFHFDDGDWQWGWSTDGSNSFSGWTYSDLFSGDKLLIGNIDADPNSEIMFIQTGVSARWATVMNYYDNKFNLGWSNYGGDEPDTYPFIDNWPVSESGGSNTFYMFVKASANEPEYLFARRKYGSKYLVSMYRMILSNDSNGIVLPSPKQFCISGTAFVSAENNVAFPVKLTSGETDFDTIGLVGNGDTPETLVSKFIEGVDITLLGNPSVGVVASEQNSSCFTIFADHDDIPLMIGDIGDDAPDCMITPCSPCTYAGGAEITEVPPSNITDIMKDFLKFQTKQREFMCEYFQKHRFGEMNINFGSLRNMMQEYVMEHGQMPDDSAVENMCETVFTGYDCSMYNDPSPMNNSTLTITSKAPGVYGNGAGDDVWSISGISSQSPQTQHLTSNDECSSDTAVSSDGNASMIAFPPYRAATFEMSFSVEKVTDPPPNSGFKLLGNAYAFTVIPDVDEFDYYVAITIKYKESDLNGTNEQDLEIHYYDESLEEWIILPSVVDTVNNTVTVVVNHFTDFAIFGPEEACQADLSVMPAVKDVSKEAGTISLNVSTNECPRQWTATASDSWLTIGNGMSGTNNGTISVNYSANSGEERTGTITVVAPGAENSPQTVEVRQAESFFYCTDKLSAKTTLTLIAREQEAYFAEHYAYSDSLEDIGVTVENNSKYQYEIDVSSNMFTATATSKAPGIGNSGQGDDVWTINQEWNLENGHTTSQECSEDKIIDGYLLLKKAIIGILNAVAIPDYQLYRCKGYQNEAVNSLKNIHTAAEAYRIDFHVYPDSIEKVEMAGWSAEPDAKYHYAIIVANGDTFLATATSKEPGIVDGGEGDDVWTINQDGELVNSVNACQTLPPPPLQPITEKKPLLVLPFNGQINMSLTPELLSGAFSEDTGTDRGQWQISTSSDFSSPVLDETGDLGETIDSAFKSHVVSGSALNEGTVYYWRVRYYNADNESSEWSDIFWFRTTGTSAADIFTVNFTVKGNGTLTGEASQSVEHCKNSAGMTAVPNASYKFTGWSGDHAGTANPLIVENVTSDMNIIANFARHFELSDAVLILKMLTGMEADGVSLELDANGNGKVGMEDVVCILQIVAEIPQ
jgi:Tfp pilus assembly protein PilE